MSQLMRSRLKNDGKTIFVNVLLFSSTVFIVSAALVYILTFYLGYSTDRALLYTANDPGYVAPGTSGTPLLGQHYFGDFLTQLSWARYGNAYDSALQYPSPYPPFATVVFRPFLHLSPALGLFFLSACTIIFLSFIFWNSINMINRSWKIYGVVILLFASKPVLLNLDRGNIQGIVVGSAIASLHYLDRSKIKPAIFFATLAIALKGYPIIILLAFVRRKCYPEILRIIGYVAILEIFSGILISGKSFLEIPIQMLRGAGIQSGENTSGMSFAASFMRIVDALGIYHPKLGHNIVFVGFSFVIGVASLIGLVIYVLKKPNWVALDNYVLIGVTSFMLPVSWTYNATWLPFLVLALSQTTYFNFENRKVLNPRNLVFALAAVNVPIPFIWRGSTRNSVGILEILLPLLFLIFAALQYRDKFNENRIEK